MKKLIFTPIIAVLFFAINLSAQNLVTNGDFELNDLISADSNLQIVSGVPSDSLVSNWSVQDNTDQGFIVNSGGNSYITSFGAEWTSDVFDVTSNTDYIFGGDSAQQTDQDSGTFGLRFLEADGITEVSISYLVISAGSYPTTGETNFSTFSTSSSINSGTATKAELFVKFEGGTNAVSFDNVFVSAIPEPSVYAMIAGALAFGFVVIRRRIKN